MQRVLRYLYIPTIVKYYDHTASYEQVFLRLSTIL